MTYELLVLCVLGPVCWPLYAGTHARLLALSSPCSLLFPAMHALTNRVCEML